MTIQWIFSCSSPTSPHVVPQFHGHTSIEKDSSDLALCCAGQAKCSESQMQGKDSLLQAIQQYYNIHMGLNITSFLFWDSKSTM